MRHSDPRLGEVQDAFEDLAKHLDDLLDDGSGRTLPPAEVERLKRARALAWRGAAIAAAGLGEARGDGAAIRSALN